MSIQKAQVTIIQKHLMSGPLKCGYPLITKLHSYPAVILSAVTNDPVVVFCVAQLSRPIVPTRLKCVPGIALSISILLQKSMEPGR